MKNIPFALGLAAFVSAATAQSTIAVYGVVDGTFASGTGTGSGSANKTYFSSGGNMTSRVGVRGSQDVSGGNTVSFVLEAQVFADSGEGQATNSNNQTTGTSTATAGSQGLTFARRSTVSYSGGWGEMRLGRDFTAHYRNRVEVDPFGNAGVGSIQPFAGSIGGPVSTRASNMLAYFLPAKLNGFYGQFQYYLGEIATGSATSEDGNGLSARLGYKNGPLNISIASGRTKYLATATNGDITSNNVGFQYDFGLVKLMAGVYRDTVGAIVPVTANGYTFGGIAPVGEGQFKFAFSKYGTDLGASPETSKISLGYVHSLTKDAVVYGTLAKVTNSGGAKTALNTSVTAANSDSTGFDFGIRVLF